VSTASKGDKSAAEKGGRRGRRRAADSASVEIDLEHGRWRHFGWTLFGLALGIVLVWKLGTVGKGVGILLVAIAAYNGHRFVQTLRHPAGKIRINDDGALLPEGLCRGKSPAIAVDQIRHAYFLRRAVPWTRAGPVLVVETAEQILLYPRDWFHSDSDQRRIATAINRRLSRL